jgi:tRNA dimethylallyltransferase
MEKSKTLLIVCGPTASGKTAMAIRLAKHLNTEILSADSRQLYRELNIGVARPSRDELAAVRHHFIASVSVEEAYSAGRFAREARTFADEFLRQHDALVVCGGTGLYIQAFLEGLDRQAASPELRQKLQNELESKGLEKLASDLKFLAPGMAAETDLQNPRRVLRALEWHYAGSTGRRAEALPSGWRIVKLAPEIPREELYERINRRVDQMLELGLWEEAVSLVEKRHLNALQTVGYREIFDCLEGKISKEEAVDKIKQHTRNYAKRQLTWFRKDSEIVWVKDGESATDILSKV